MHRPWTQLLWECLWELLSPFVCQTGIFQAMRFLHVMNWIIHLTSLWKGNKNMNMTLHTTHTHLVYSSLCIYCDELLLEGLHNYELVIRTCLDWGLWGNWIMDLNSRVMCCGLSLLWLVIMIIEWQVVHNTLCIVVTQAETVKQLMSAVSTAHSLWTRGLEWEG